MITFLSFQVRRMSDSTFFVVKSKQIPLISGYLRECVNEYWINDIINIIKKYLITPFYWDKNTLQKGYVLSNDQLTITNQNTESDWINGYCNVTFNSGIHSFEIELLKLKQSHSIMIGIIESNFTIPLDRFPGNCDAIGCTYQTNCTCYGADNNIFKTNDIIQGKKGNIVKCIVNFDDGLMEFYVNNKIQRKEAIHLNGKEFRIVVNMFLFGDSVKLLNVT